MNEMGSQNGGEGIRPGELPQQPALNPEAFCVPQQVQPILNRAACDRNQMVYLKQYCFTAAQVFPPGEYRAYQLPDIAFGMGMVIPPPQPSIQVPKQETIELVLEKDSLKGAVTPDAE